MTPPKVHGNYSRSLPHRGTLVDGKAPLAAVDAFGRLDVIVNNAGYGDVAPFEQLSLERFKAVVDTNFDGVVNVTPRCTTDHAKAKERRHRAGEVKR